MSTQLSHKPDITGFSRNKILFTGIIVGVIVIFVIFLGTTMVPESKQSINDEDNKYTNNDNPSQSADNIIQSVKEKIQKESSAQNAANIIDNNSNKPVILTNQNNNQLSNTTVVVPPISNTDEQQMKTQQVQIQHQFELKRLQNQYAAYSSRTLIYAGSQQKNNTPDSVSEDALGENKQKEEATDNQLPRQSSTIDNIRKPTNGGNSITSDETKDQNNQAAKINFAATSGDKTVNGATSQYLNAKIENPISPYILSAGSVIPSTMISGLNSDLPGQITAFVRENVYDSATHRILLIPQGSKLVGLYDSNISYGQKRILVAWNRLIYPDASSIMLKAMPGTDLQGFAGFYDQVDNHYWKLFGNSFIMGVITGAMQYSQNNTNSNVQSGGVGFTNPNPSVGQTLSGSLGQQLGQTSLSMAQKNLNIQPTLSVNPGYPFNVMTTADMVLRPYRK